MGIRLIFAFLILAPGLSTGQNDRKNFTTAEDSLRNLARTVIHSPDFHTRTEANTRLIDHFTSILQDESSPSYPFDSLKYIVKVEPRDKSFRLFTWFLADEDGNHEFFGLLQTPRKKKSPVVTRLTDRSDSIADPARMTLTKDQWYGALYYELVAPERRKNRQYLLLGWDGNNSTSNRKVIDVISVSPRGEPRFGGTIPTEKKPAKRLLFEYAEDATMSLKYDPRSGMIIFDHLAPTAPHLKDNPEFYGPDFSFDGLQYEKGRWIYIRDIDARNPGKRQPYNAPKP